MKELRFVRPLNVLNAIFLYFSACHQDSGGRQGGYEPESRYQESRRNSRDSLIIADGALAVPYLPQYVPANGHEIQKGDAVSGSPFLLADDIILRDVYPEILKDVATRRLMEGARSDSAFLRQTFPSSLFLYMAGNDFLEYPALYALLFYGDNSGVIYYVCDRDAFDDSATVQTRTISAYLPKLISEIVEAKIPSRPDVSSEGTSSAIISFLVEGKPQVIAQRNALPFHTDPGLWVSEWRKPYVAGRALIDSLIWGIANVACGIDPRLSGDSIPH